MNLTPTELAALDAGIVRIGMFLRIATTPVIRLWLGVGKIKPGANVLDAANEEYLGLGELRSVPEFSQLINGTAERIEFVASGVSGPLLAKATEEQDEVADKEVAVGFALMGPDWALLGSIRWVRLFYSDFIGVDQQASEGDGVRTIRLSCGSLMTGRRRPGLAYYSDSDQQRRSPGDRFFERVPKYSQDIRKTWPRF